MPDIFTVPIAGEERVIGGAWLPTTAMPDELCTIFGDTPNTTLIPRGEWRPTTLRRFCPPIKDQDGIGACNAFASVTALEICRAMKGLPHVELSPGDLYRRVSGGRDRGSLPQDALRELMERGTCTARTVPPLDWRTVTPEASREYPRFRITEALWCPTFDHAASAVMQGFALNVSVWWYRDDPVGDDGWMRPEGRGSRGGHSVAGISLDLRHDFWGIGIQNSLTTRFGKDGYAILPERRVRDGAQDFRIWAVRECVQEDVDFPAPQE